MTRRLLLLPATLLVASLTGCPKEEPVATATPVPSATAMATADAMASATPVATGAMAMATPTPDAASGEQSITYRWSGGLSPYQYYELNIRGSDTAKVTFKVKPLRTEERVVEDTLTAEQFGELKRLFTEVKFDEVTTEPRKIRVMDIGQTVITRESGASKKEVIESPTQTVAPGYEIRPLRKWMDERVRAYLEQAGVAPGGKKPPPK